MESRLTSMLPAVALAAITSVEGAFAEGGEGRTALRESSVGTGPMAAVIAAAVRDLAGRRAANVAGNSTGASTCLALMDVAVGRVVSSPTKVRPPLSDAAAPQPVPLPARLLALPPPAR